MGGWDRALFYGINGWPDGLAPFFKFLSEGTDSPIVRIILLLLIVSMACFRQTRKGGMLGGLCWPLADLLTKLWKDYLPRPRPFQELSDVIVRTGTSESMGTASAHSGNMMFVAVVFCYYFRWWGMPWVVLALLTGISRVYVGVHYPYQVLLGWATGAAAAAAVIFVAEMIANRRKRNEDTLDGSDVPGRSDSGAV